MIAYDYAGTKIDKELWDEDLDENGCWILRIRGFASLTITTSAVLDLDYVSDVWVTNRTTEFLTILFIVTTVVFSIIRFVRYRVVIKELV